MLRISETAGENGKVITYEDGSQILAPVKSSFSMTDKVFSRCWDNLSLTQQQKINREVINSRS